MVKKCLTYLLLLAPLCLSALDEAEPPAAPKSIAMATAQKSQKDTQQTKKASPTKKEQAQPKKTLSPTPSQQQDPSPEPQEQPEDLEMDEEGLPKPTGDAPTLAGDGYKTQFYKTVIAVVIVFILVIIAVFMLRRFSHARPLYMNSRKNIKIIEKRALSPNTFLYHLQIADKQIIVAESKFEVRMITSLDWNETDTTM